MNWVASLSCWWRGKHKWCIPTVLLDAKGEWDLKICQVCFKVEKKWLRYRMEDRYNDYN